MKPIVPFLRRSLLACLFGTGIVASTHAATVYDSGGFESPVFLLEQPLAGQDPAPPLGNGPWGRDNGGSSAVVTAANAIDGTKSVKITRAAGSSGNTRWAVVKPISPTGTQNVVEIRFDMKVVQKTNDFGPLFGIEAYDAGAGTPKLIGGLLHDASTGELLCQQAGTGVVVGTGFYPDLARHQHYRMAVNFSAKTYSLQVNGRLVHTEGFVNPAATKFTDAPLVTLGVSGQGREGVAYVDNYRIDQTTSKLPHLLWKGDGVNNFWDLARTANWFDGIGPIEFRNGEAVRFEDDGIATPAIRLDDVVAPASVTVSSSKDHEITGAGSISGTTGLVKEGTGTLVLSNANGYSGVTRLAGGRLSVRNTTGSATGTGNVTVAAMSTLTGDGRIGGSVQVAPGGVIEPGNGVGTLSIGGSLVLNDARLKYSIGGSRDLLAVSGDLALGGTLEVTDAGGFGPGTHPILTYGGELTAGSLLVSSAPDGYAYRIDTATPGVVALVVTPPPPAPAAPRNLAAVSTGTSTIDLGWTDQSSNEDSFVIERAQGGGAFNVIASTAADSTSFSDGGLASGTTYSYRVRAVNTGGESAYSNTAGARTQLSPAVARYEFELTTLDSSGNNNHGAPVGTLLYEDGQVGDNAATFGGTAFMEITRVVESNFTVMMWVKTTANASGGGWYSGMGLVDGEMVGGAADWGCSVLNSKFAFGVGAPDTTILSNRSINDGGWHHLAATRDNSTGEVRLYIDGVLDTVAAAPSGPRTAPSQLRVGASQSANPVFYVGAMDDLRFYNAVLNGAEVAELAGDPAPPPPPAADPLVIWPLGDSITWGYTTASAADSPGGYREPLYRNLLVNQYPAMKFVGANTSNPGPLLTRDNQVAHDGYPQYTITEISNNLDSNAPTGKTRGNNGGFWLTGGGVRPALDPDIVLLLAGTNDIEAGADAPLIESRMSAMVGKIFHQRPGTTIYLASIPPYPADVVKAAKAKAYNELIVSRTIPKHLAAGHDIRFVDQYPNFVLAEGPNGPVANASLYGDTIHPNEAGYQLMGDTWAAALMAPPQAPPNAPAGLVATSVTSAGVTLEWADRSSDEGVFLIQRSLDGVAFETIGHVGPDVTVFTDRSAGGPTTYGYRVVARNSGGDSDASNYITVTTAARPLTAHLRFDEATGSTAFDSSGSGNDGTLVGGPVWTGGTLGNAIDLDGADDHVTLPAAIVSGLGDFTITSWVKVDAQRNWSRVFDFGTGVTNYMFLTPRSGSKGTMRFAMLTPGSGGEQGIDAPAAVPTGVWTHVAVSLSGTTATLYMNGESVGTHPSMTLTPASLGGTNQNYIGKSQWNDPLLDGAVDDFQIHDRALSAGEVRSLAEMTQPVALPAAPIGLVAVESDGKIELSWDPVDGATSYSVYRSAGSGYVLVASGLTSPAFIDSTVTNGTTYSYVVTASNSAGESGFSGVFEATPRPRAEFSGRAIVIRLDVLGSDLNWGDTGELPLEGGAREASFLSVDEAGLVAGEIGHAFTIGQADRTRSEASVGNLEINAEGVVIEAGFVMARALAVYQAGGTTGLAGGAEIGDLTVAGTPVTVTGEPNQVVNLPLVGQLIIDERITTDTSITVNALRVSLLSGAEIIVASATAGYQSVEPPPPFGDDRLTGGGWIADGNGGKTGNFGVAGGYQEGVLGGHLTYRDHATGMKVKGSAITAYLQGPTPESRRIEGTCEIDGQGGFTFVVIAADHGEPGDADTFRIELSNGYQAEGVLGGGNIQLHLPGE